MAPPMVHMALHTRICVALVLVVNLGAGEVVWTEWASLEGGPAQRSKLAVALTERAGLLDTQPHLLMFGGCDTAGARSDLWKLSLGFLPLPSISSESDPATAGIIDLNPANDPSWVEVGRSASWPSARCEHSLTTLEDGRVVMFGGRSGLSSGAALNDVWIYDAVSGFSSVAKPANISTATCDTNGQAWPYKRYGHATTALGSTMWMFGGWVFACGQNSVSDELWSFSAASSTWARQPPKSLRPAARTSHNAMAYGSSILVLGGWDGALPTDDMWVYNPASLIWSQLHTSNSPAEPGPKKRYGASLNPVAGGMVLHGGSDRASGASGEFFSDLWVFTFPRDIEETSTTTSESVTGSGTQTTTTTTKVSPVNKNLWMPVTDESYADVPQRAYHGSLVFGKPGYEHVIIFGGSESR
jgi:hypothetical protein